MPAMEVFGDSIAAGNGVTLNSQKWCYITAGNFGLSVNMHAAAGATSYGQGPVIYSFSTTSDSVSTYLIGVNETSTANQAVYQNILMAECLWLLIPNANKVLAQAMSVTGTWATSTVNPSFGRQSVTNGSTATATVFGSVVYIGFWATLSNAAVVNVTVDGVAFGPYTPATSWTSSDSLTTAPYAVRISGLTNTSHTVVITLTTANSSTLFLDHVSGNSGFITQNGPLLYLSNCQKTATNSYAASYNVSSAMQTVVNNLTADGLMIAFVDTAARCLDNCHGADGTHPDAAGQLLIMNAFMPQFGNFHRFVRPN